MIGSFNCAFHFNDRISFCHSKGQELITIKSGNYSFNVPEEYFQEREDIPSFWISAVDEIAEFLYKNVEKGQVKIIGTSAGGKAYPCGYLWKATHR